MGRQGFRLAVMLVVVLIFGLALVWSYLADGTQAPTYAYSELLADAAAGNVVAITQSGTDLTVTKRGVSTPLRVAVASESINVYAEVCAAAGASLGGCPIDYAAVEASAAGSIVTLLITSLLPVVLIGSFIYFMMRQAQRGKSGG